VPKKFTAVISNYRPRGFEDAFRLAREVGGLVDEVLIVSNDDTCKQLVISEVSPRVITRPNVGMNIGAWSAAIPYCDADSHIIFLQDECRVVNPGFVNRYRQLLSNDRIGMVGESLNLKWNRPWAQMENSPLNYAMKTDNGFETRVSFYLRCFRSWAVEPGSNGLHLRALVWGFNCDLLRKIQEFPIGKCKEECIASEIAVSKLINQQGLDFVQSHSTPFFFFQHAEWEANGWQKRQVP
jgi:hypothetical protein